MNNKLERKLAELQSTRTKLLAELKLCATEKLEMPPAPGKWSAAQVIYHLNKAESQSVIYVSKKMKDLNNLKRTGFIEWAKITIVKLALASPIKYKAPVNVLGEVPEHVNYDAIVTEWNETRKKLTELLYALPEDILEKNVFKQPAAGRLNIYQMLDFMQSHFDRHRKQIERAIA
jgi:hypothetical protein